MITFWFQVPKGQLRSLCPSADSYTNPLGAGLKLRAREAGRVVFSFFGCPGGWQDERGNPGCSKDFAMFSDNPRICPGFDHVLYFPGGTPLPPEFAPMSQFRGAWLVCRQLRALRVSRGKHMMFNATRGNMPQGPK